MFASTVGNILIIEITDFINNIIHKITVQVKYSRMKKNMYTITKQLLLSPKLCSAYTFNIRIDGTVAYNFHI